MGKRAEMIVDHTERIDKGLRRLRKAMKDKKKKKIDIPELVESKYAILSRTNGRLHLKAAYSRQEYDAIVRDPDLANLIGILYIHHLIRRGYTSYKETDGSLINTSLDIFGASDLTEAQNTARNFLHSESFASQRDAVKEYMSLPFFSETQMCESKEEEDVVNKPCVQEREDVQKLDRIASVVHRSMKATYSYFHKPAQKCKKQETEPTKCFPELSDQEIEFLVYGLLQDPTFRELVLPCKLPSSVSHRQKVRDGIEIARMVLTDVKVNIFWGCTFTYSDMKAAISKDASEAAVQKLNNASPLLLYLQAFPSRLDKEFRCTYLKAQLSDQERADLRYTTPEDFPTSVPPEINDYDTTEKDIRVVRALPFIDTYIPPWYSNPVKFMTEVYAVDAPNLIDLLRMEEFNERVKLMSLLRALDEVSPNPADVYHILVSRGEV